MKVIVDSGKCVSAGNCVAHAPDVFDQDEDDGSVILLQHNPASDRDADVRHAAAACPASAISLAD